jgi:hypothetical protein
VADDRPGFFQNRALAQLTAAIGDGKTEKALSLIRPDLPLDAVAKGSTARPCSQRSCAWSSRAART